MILLLWFQLGINLIVRIVLLVQNKQKLLFKQKNYIISKLQLKILRMLVKCLQILHNIQHKKNYKEEKQEQVIKVVENYKIIILIIKIKVDIIVVAEQFQEIVYILIYNQIHTNNYNFLILIYRKNYDRIQSNIQYQLFQIILFVESMKKVQTTGLKKLKLQDYQIGRTLGKGGFGKVKVARNKKNGKFVALKLLKKSQIIKSQQIDHVYNENSIHSQISHPFIVNFEGLAQDTKHLYLVLQLINGGELFTYLRSIQSIPTDQCRFYAGIVALCFEYLHSKNTIFRDLKPQNLLITNEGYLKLTDFGFAKILQDGRTFTICGTPEYIAPQVILNQGHGKAVDWWTLGVLIYEMHAGIDPFSDDDAMGIYKNILKGKVSFPSIFDKQAKDAKSLIRHLLVADLSKRYGNLKDGANDIKKHRWFTGFNWQDLIKLKMKPAYIPTVKSLGDVSNFDQYPDSGSVVPEIKPSVDPFLNW